MPISDYVRELRELIGHRRLLLPSVSVLVWNDAGELLMVRNAETHMWQTVGGSVEPGENPREAAVREALEETGLEIALTGIRGTSGGPAYQLTYPNGDRVAYAGTVFDARPTGGRLLADGDGDETSAARWWPLAQLHSAQMTELTRTLLTDQGVFSAAA